MIRRPDLDADREDGRADGERLAREMERDRCRAIMTGAHAELRGRLAKHLALATDLPAAEAIAILRTAPVDAAITDRVQ